MKKNLVLVFAKNILLGKVKTRLAATIGDQNAFEVYKHLVEITERETKRLEDTAVHIWFSDVVIGEKWPNAPKFVQHGADLGERMSAAFQHGFAAGYERIIGIGSDLPDLTAEIMQEGLDALDAFDTVFGPAEDGGYYLLGMKKIQPLIFEDQAWSTSALLQDTLSVLSTAKISSKLLQPLNDIDNLEDLKASSIAHRFEALTKKKSAR
ncbi:MAG: hypothetical protein A3D92_16890 [Bacteroidetes bacterium RIFCSPHIGHO2_02_FULL_44_7]|nr:MAG: hypothetical protein A3D92_16890 [Bacteroidetes bacterium RIFCSPHIGHO2_02_FULL_44_7]